MKVNLNTYEIKEYIILDTNRMGLKLCIDLMLDARIW